MSMSVAIYICKALNYGRDSPEGVLRVVCHAIVFMILLIRMLFDVKYLTIKYF